jgi:hypothetical protein
MKTNKKETELIHESGLTKSKDKIKTDSLTNDPTKREQEISYKRKHKIGDPIKKVK